LYFPLPGAPLQPNSPGKNAYQGGNSAGLLKMASPSAAVTASRMGNPRNVRQSFTGDVD
jgi:hypothetical protein